MLQEASTHFIVLEPLEDLIVSEPWSIESSADGLMDELFADIDQILDGSGNLTNQILQHGTVRLKSSPRRGSVPDLEEPARSSEKLEGRLPQIQTTSGSPRYNDYRRTGVEDPLRAQPLEYVPLQTVRMPQIVLPETLIQSVQAVPQLRNKQLSTVLVNPNAVGMSKPRQKWRRTFGKLLSVGIPLGLVITAIIWTLHSGVLNRLMTKSFRQTLLKQQPQLPTTASVEADLVDYILGSLAAIDRQEANNQKAKTLLTTVAPVGDRRIGNLPPPLAANNTLPASSRSTTLVERIYIPVYQAPSPMRYVPPPLLNALNPLPRLPFAPKNIALNAQPHPVKTALNTLPKPALPVAVNALVAVRPELKPVAVRTTPVTVKQPPKPPVLPVLPSRVASAKLPTAQPSPSSTREEMIPVAYAPAIPVSSHILEGLLELGNKSAALFKIDGVTRRVDIGEGIGASGWTLVDVANGEAVIRRNGEVRSIYTGQKF